MSVLHVCSNPKCDREWESGLDGSGGLCSHCRRVNQRIAGGGIGLSSDERAAVAHFLGAEIGDSSYPFIIEDSLHGMIWGDPEGAFKAYDAVEPISAFDPVRVAEAAVAQASGF